MGERGPLPVPRFSFVPVDDLVRAWCGPDAVIGWRSGASASLVRSWRERGLSPWQADLVATHLGSHPSLLWPDWDTVLDAYDLARETRTAVMAEARRARYRDANVRVPAGVAA